MKKGVSLIELLVYVALLSIIILVLYDVFVVTGYTKITEIANSELSTNANYIISQVTYSVRSAETLTTPNPGTSGQSLILNGGAVTFVFANGELIKSEDAISAPVHTDDIILDSLSFQHITPSAIAPSVLMTFTAHSRHLGQGGPISKTFQTAISLRQ
jgi:hypothetical protein